MIKKINKRISYIHEMKSHVKLLLVIPTVFLLGISVTNFGLVYSQADIDTTAGSNSWISERDNLNITMNLTPTVPAIDQPTEIEFEIRDLDGNLHNDIGANVTILDSDGRLFKFPQQPAPDGIFSVIYIFPDDAINNIIVQMERNSTTFGVASFDVVVPPSPAPGDLLSQLIQPRPF